MEKNKLILAQPDFNKKIIKILTLKKHFSILLKNFKVFF